MVPVELIEVAFVAATTGVIGAAVSVRSALRRLAMRRAAEGADTGRRADPYRAPSVAVEAAAPSPTRRRGRARRAQDDEVVRWPRGLR